MQKTFKEEPFELEYFEISEFDSPDLPGSGSNMKISTLLKLEQARKLANVPFRVNSGFRTKAHNAKLKDSVPNSSHTLGYAADIRTPNLEVQKKIIAACIIAGFKRIGVGRTYIHVDDDPTKKSPAVWTYGGLKLTFNPFKLKI